MAIQNEGKPDIISQNKKICVCSPYMDTQNYQKEELFVKGYLEIGPEMGGIRDKDINRYECQYIDESRIEDKFFDICEGCELMVEEPDINCADCPTGFDYTDIHCARSYRYTYVKRYLMYADMLLRNTLGDIWKDEYSA